MANKTGADACPKSAYNRDLGKIWLGAKNLGMDSEMLHELLENITGKTSLKNTNATERALLIADLDSKDAYGYKKKSEKPRSSAPRTNGAGRDVITPAQQHYINDLWIALSKTDSNAESTPWRYAFTDRIIHRPWPQKKWEAQKLIEALKKRLKAGNVE